MSERRDSSRPSITNALLLAELDSYCGSDSLSEDGLRKVIERHGQRYDFFRKACCNERVTVGIIRCLLENFPGAASATDAHGQTPLHILCKNKNVTLEIVRLLIDAFPGSLHQEDNDGCMPLHYVCLNKNLDDSISLEILTLLVEKCPESVRHSSIRGNLPLHQACGVGGKSPDFCRTLIEAYLGSEQMANIRGVLPFHHACLDGTVATAEYLYKLYPGAIDVADENGRYPIQYAFAGIEKRNDTSTAIEMVRFLLDCDGRTLRQDGIIVMKSLHYVCNKKFDDSISLEILTLFVEKCPESVRHADIHGYLPLHHACGRGGKSPDFCRTLIEAYPESVRYANNIGSLPFHYACCFGTVATAEYLYKLIPNAINMADKKGRYPIHYAIEGINQRNDTSTAIEMVRFLLDCDLNVAALQTLGGKLPLAQLLASSSSNTSMLNAYLEVMRLLFDAHPAAIENNGMLSNLGTLCPKIQTFINTQLAYARQSRDYRLMTTPDENGQLPLHRALCDNVTLGSIKLLVNGNPSAVQTTDYSGALPLHIACQHHDSASVVQYLLGLHATTIRAVDLDNNTVLHYACRGAKHNTIALLLEKYDAASVSKRNAQNKLPIDLLLESDEVRDREGIEYMDSIYRLIRAYPETLMSLNSNTKQATFQDFPSHIVKKRKIGVD